MVLDIDERTSSYLTGYQSRKILRTFGALQRREGISGNIKSIARLWYLLSGLEGNIDGLVHPTSALERDWRRSGS
jgi:hypothetical protein